MQSTTQITTNEQVLIIREELLKPGPPSHLSNKKQNPYTLQQHLEKAALYLACSPAEVIDTLDTLYVMQILKVWHNPEKLEVVYDRFYKVFYRVNHTHQKLKYVFANCRKRFKALEEAPHV